MCVCAHTYEHPCLSLQSPENNLKYWSSGTIHIGLDFLFGLDLTKQARLAGKQAPGTHLSLPLQCWDYSNIPPHLAFFFFLMRIELKSPCINTLLTKLSLSLGIIIIINYWINENREVEPLIGPRPYS